MYCNQRRVYTLILARESRRIFLCLENKFLQFQLCVLSTSWSPQSLSNITNDTFTAMISTLPQDGLAYKLLRISYTAKYAISIYHGGYKYAIYSKISHGNGRCYGNIQIDEMVACSAF